MCSKQWFLSSSLPSSQIYPTRSCCLYQMVLISVFWYILFCLWLFRGFSPCFFFFFFIFSSSSFSWCPCWGFCCSLLAWGVGFFFSNGRINGFSFITLSRKKPSVPQVTTVISTSPAPRVHVCTCVQSFALAHAIVPVLVGGIPAEPRPQLVPSYYLKKEESIKAQIQAPICTGLLPTVLSLISTAVIKRCLQENKRWIFLSWGYWAGANGLSLEDGEAAASSPGTPQRR